MSHGIDLKTKIQLSIDMIDTRRFFHAVSHRLFGSVGVLTATMMTFTQVAFDVFINRLEALHLRCTQTNMIFKNSRFSILFLACFFLLRDLPRFNVVVNGIRFALWRPRLLARLAVGFLTFVNNPIKRQQAMWPGRYTVANLSGKVCTGSCLRTARNFKRWETYGQGQVSFRIYSTGFSLRRVLSRGRREAVCVTKLFFVEYV